MSEIVQYHIAKELKSVKTRMFFRESIAYLRFYIYLCH